LVHSIVRIGANQYLAVRVILEDVVHNGGEQDRLACARRAYDDTDPLGHHLLNDLLLQFIELVQTRDVEVELECLGQFVFLLHLRENDSLQDLLGTLLLVFFLLLIAIHTAFREVYFLDILERREPSVPNDRVVRVFVFNGFTQFLSIVFEFGEHDLPLGPLDRVHLGDADAVGDLLLG